MPCCRAVLPRCAAAPAAEVAALGAQQARRGQGWPINLGRAALHLPGRLGHASCFCCCVAPIATTAGQASQRVLCTTQSCAHLWLAGILLLLFLLLLGRRGGRRLLRRLLRLLLGRCCGRRLGLLRRLLLVGSRRGSCLRLGCLGRRLLGGSCRRLRLALLPRLLRLLRLLGSRLQCRRLLLLRLRLRLCKQEAPQCSG